MGLSGKPKILVVDDDPAITGLLRRGFSYEGYEVLTANSGSEALAIAGEKRPDLIVLDIMLPDMSGLEVCQRLRSTEPNLPIVMLTARDAPADEIAGLHIGADDYITKPFSFELLLAHIQALLRRREDKQPEAQEER